GKASSGSWLVWIGVAWFIGAAIVALRFFRSHLAARRLVRVTEPPSGAARSAAATAAAALGIGRSIDIARCDLIAPPMTIVVLRGGVLLPAEADDWSSERLHAVLLHELGHVRRRDNLVQLAAHVACAVHWCNPLVWLAAARLRVEREYACDDLVL